MGGILAIISAVSALSFVLVWTFRCPWRKSQTSSIVYDVMQLGDKWIAFRKPSKIGWGIGFLYASLFCLCLPILLVRYTVWRAMGLIVIPLAVIYGISFLLAQIIGMEAMAINLMLQVPIRLYVGFYVKDNDFKYRQDALLARGWKFVGTNPANSKKLAIKAFRGPDAVTEGGPIRLRHRFATVRAKISARIPVRNKLELPEV